MANIFDPSAPKGFLIDETTRQFVKPPEADYLAAVKAAGGNRISGPSGLQGLAEHQIARDPNSPDIYRLPGGQVAESGRSLEGTLSGTSSTGGVTGGDRTLADSTSGLDAFKNALKNTAMIARANAPSATQEIQGFNESVGLAHALPGVSSDIVGQGTLSRATVEESRYSGIVDMLKAQQESRLEHGRLVMSTLASQYPDLMLSLSAQDFESIKTGQLSPDLIKRIELEEQNAPAEKGELRTVDGSLYSITYDAQGNPISTLVQAKVPKAVGGGGGGSVDASGLPKGFISAINSGMAQLKDGETWGIVWNRVKARFPAVENATIDAMLGGSADTGLVPGGAGPAAPPTGFAAPGAYEELVGKQQGLKPVTNVALEQQIWKELGENPGLDDETKAEWIKQQGGNPADFGVY